MGDGHCILYQCNITRNRVKTDTGGYLISTNDNPFISYINVIENYQSYGEFNSHTSSQSSESRYLVTFCNYVRNKAPSGSLIYTDTILDMNYCCIVQNKLPFIFFARTRRSQITFENSSTDGTTFKRIGPTFKTTNLSECLLLYKTKKVINITDDVSYLFKFYRRH
ncbi:hypothetical protein TVAG_288640 [Trichomonas vaginalis G3]|uniref:Right handed beta helix domain-containing protein n=1 Tax=Trichomonas vaginalis (strain ATCC PRA-98 / G3) TaxID=412133 RepID=A2FEC3_TRIV3|nr:hypothetical protein TVAGG3_0545650 [Trichomonas vaginalis G3]EAX96763.1 hypothetical protein TVAG_288640 [Trichomonas vaginalis G3]KAI5520157.1 hypothetical protein TVAGG3_0545650 [Trichomonas vaginalis G3]|eukprot:XP_001309693.1 hypothetical protein [Trichomonas vaginalis G3]